MHQLLAHGGTLCPDEMLAALTAVGASGGIIFMAKVKWHRIRVWVGFRLIARHLRRCHGECNFVYSYAPGKGLLAPR